MVPAPARAAIVGVVHGVLEWLPVSSSGHVALLVDRAGWPESDPAGARHLRTLEVALHSGSLLPLGLRVAGDARASEAPARLLAAGVGATAITSVIGALAGPQVEERFSGPRAVAAGLVAGSLALLAAERLAAGNADGSAARGANGGGSGSGSASSRGVGRTAGEIALLDVLVVGAAQGCAIWPGVSRRAATLAAARARGLDARTADALSWAAGLPTLLGATTWQGYRDREGLASAAPTVAAGAAVSAAIGTATRSLPDRTRRWPAAAWAAWRLALAAATLRRRPAR